MNDKYLIGMKTSLHDEALQNKLFSGLEFVELYLKDTDFEDENFIMMKIKEILLVYPSIKIMLHCPVITEKNGYRYTISILDEKSYDYTKKMYEICVKNKSVVGFVMHIENGKEKSSKKLFKKKLELIRKDFKNIDNYMYVENLIDIMTQKKDDFLSLLKEFNIKKVCFDFAHFSAFNCEADFYDTLKYLTENYEIYCHISDNKFLCKNPIPMNLNSSGEINFEKATDYLRFGILETYSKNELIGEEMKKDYFALMEIIEKKKQMIQIKKVTKIYK